MRRLVVLTVLALVAATLALASPATAGSRYTVTAIAGATSVDVGQAFTLRGRVTPRASGQRVLIQRLSGSTWVTVKRTRINRFGRYRTSVTVNHPGDNRYRVLKRRSLGHPRGVSPSVTVVGWRWRPLTSLPTEGMTSNATLLASGNLGPTAFPATYQPLLRLGSAAGVDGAITYVLANNCTKFDSDVGVTTDSASGAAQLARIGVLPQGGGMGVLIADQAVTRNQDPAHIVRTGAVIADAWTLELIGDVNAANTFVGWGDPQVYCKS
jgi:hypothetical protein